MKTLCETYRDYWIVLAKIGYGESQGQYELSTRRVFLTHEEAESYVKSISTSYEPIIVSGRWHQLRLP